MSVGKIIKAIRQEKGLKQMDIVNKTKLSKSYISAIEKGTKTPRIEQLELIGEALGVPISVLFLLASGVKNVKNTSKAKLINELSSVIKQISELFNNESDFDSSEVIKAIKNEKLVAS